MAKGISRFIGSDYGFLSNFYPVDIELDGCTYRTVEHAYQAAKTHDEIERLLILTRTTPAAAKAAGRRVTLRSDWDDVRVGIMTDLIAKKFAPGSPLAKRLLATGDARLVEGNTWHDTFWGVNIHDGVGLNWLGLLLMNQRDKLRTLALDSRAIPVVE